MKCVIGIDLGSTTTKAVVLDENEEMVGHGITNSRSNYDIACNIARNEAFSNVRFTLCSRALPQAGMTEGDAADYLGALERAFRFAQHRVQLAALAEQTMAEVPAVEKFFPGISLAGAVREIMDQMERDAEGLFATGVERRSDFFRDVASSQYHAMAEKLAVPKISPFDSLMAVFDKSILKVENREFVLGFDEGAGWAIERANRERDLVDSAQGAKVRTLLTDAFQEDLTLMESVGTGYGRARLPFRRDQIRSEILCHGLGAHKMFPNTATVHDIGGQDTKAIQVDPQGIVTSFQMNDRCAAGCGRYLGYIADEMNLGLHELGPLATRSQRPVKINSTCTVFAGAEIRDRLTLGQKQEDILAGLHRAVILRAMSLIARSGGIDNEFTFTGGVAKNETAVRVLRQLVQTHYGEDIHINISAASIYTGALGGALFALRNVHTQASAAAEEIAV